MNDIIIETVNRDGTLGDGIVIEGGDVTIDDDDILLAEEEEEINEDDEEPFNFDTMGPVDPDVPQEPAPPSDDDVSSEEEGAAGRPRRNVNPIQRFSPSHQTRPRAAAPVPPPLLLLSLLPILG